MALPAFDIRSDYTWLMEAMRTSPPVLATSYWLDAFSRWIPEPGERTYHEMYGGKLLFPAEPYDDGGGAAIAAIRYQGCMHA